MNNKRCIIISASPETDPEFIRTSVKADDFIICADGGYEFAKKAQIIPNLYVGDFDSYKGDVQENVKIIKLNTNKNYTDTTHSIMEAVDLGFKEVLIYGALGGRLDHTFSNLTALEFAYKKGIKARLLSKNERVEYLPCGKHIINNTKNKTFSVFPYGCSEMKISFLSEVAYKAKSLVIPSYLSRGQSNISLSDNLEIEIEQGSALLIINNSL